VPQHAPDSDGRDVSLALAPSDRAPGLAREALRPLSGKLGKSAYETLQLLVTELVTNSVRHAGLSRDQRIRLRVALSGDGVWAEVREPGKGFACERPPAPGKSGGWGLFLVNRLARRWNVNKDGETAVWFELDA
jgi:anti-sigma regulatory factor (Ser/Thr protein kinase)